MILDQFTPPHGAEALDFMWHTFDIILACATKELGPADVVRKLRDKADIIEAIATRRMH